MIKLGSQELGMIASHRRNTCKKIKLTTNNRQLANLAGGIYYDNSKKNCDYT